MDYEITLREEWQTQAFAYIEQAVRSIYEEHPHVVKAILLGAASLILGFGAYKEYTLISKNVVREEL